MNYFMVIDAIAFLDQEKDSILALPLADQDTVRLAEIADEKVELERLKTIYSGLGNFGEDVIGA